MNDTVWPKDIMIPKLEEYGREITPCHPTPSRNAMHEVLDQYDHLTRTDEKPMRLHLCGNGSKFDDDGKQIGHCCANPDHIKIGTHKENMNMPDACTEEKRRKLSEAAKGENNPFYGKTHSEETKQKISATMKGIPKSEKTKQKMRKPKRKITCPHCGREIGINTFSRHEPVCKEKGIQHQIFDADVFMKNPPSLE